MRIRTIFALLFVYAYGSANRDPRSCSLFRSKLQSFQVPHHGYEFIDPLIKAVQLDPPKQFCATSMHCQVSVDKYSRTLPLNLGARRWLNSNMAANCLGVRRPRTDALRLSTSACQVEPLYSPFFVVEFKSVGGAHSSLNCCRPPTDRLTAFQFITAKLIFQI
jgi:hypothetical protein